jgi:hypothetical protein
MLRVDNQVSGVRGPRERMAFTDITLSTSLQSLISEFGKSPPGSKRARECDARPEADAGQLHDFQAAKAFFKGHLRTMVAIVRRLMPKSHREPDELA